MPATLVIITILTNADGLAFFNFSQKLEVRFTNYKKIKCVVFHRKINPILQNCNTECSLRGMVTKMTKNSKKTQKTQKTRKTKKSQKKQKQKKNKKNAKRKKISRAPPGPPRPPTKHPGVLLGGGGSVVK